MQERHRPYLGAKTDNTINQALVVFCPMSYISKIKKKNYLWKIVTHKIILWDLLQYG